MSLDKLPIIVVNYSGSVMTVSVHFCLLPVSASCSVTELKKCHTDTHTDSAVKNRQGEYLV